MSDEKNTLVELPAEWVLKKAFGPVLEEIGEDFKKLYALGRDKIFIAGCKKIRNKDDKKKANLRVTRDVFWNGSFSDESICAEYFGGILASSRSKDGKDDTGVYYVDLIKSLSSNQLKLHYLIYLSFNKYFISDPSLYGLNPGQETELVSKNIFLSTNELLKIIDEKDIGRDLHAINAKGLIGDFGLQRHTLKNGRQVPYLKVSPKSLGIQLYAVAHNKLDEWRYFALRDFGNFDSLASLKFRGHDLEQLLLSAGIKDELESPRSLLVSESDKNVRDVQL